MAFKPGQSGNPGGRTAEKLISDALRLAVRRDQGRLNRIAERVASMAEDGDRWAISFLADRLEGRAEANVNVNQSTEVTIRSAAISAIDALIGEVTGTGAGGDDTDPVRH